MGQLGLIQDIKCLFGRHVMHPYNYYDSDILFYSNVCINCHKGIWSSYVRLLAPDEKDKPIWEILGITEKVWDSKTDRVPFLELPDERVEN